MKFKAKIIMKMFSERHYMSFYGHFKVKKWPKWVKKIFFEIFFKNKITHDIYHQKVSEKHIIHIF